jgi:hypothetical protein
VQGQCGEGSACERSPGYEHKDSGPVTFVLALALPAIKDESTDFTKALEKGLAEYGSSFSPPLYDGRLRDQSQEFLNEIHPSHYFAT